MTIAIPFIAGTPGTPEQLTAGSLWKVADLTALAAVDDLDFSGFVADGDILIHVRDKGHYRWISGTTPAVASPLVIASYRGNRWVLQQGLGGGGLLGGSIFLVDPSPPAATDASTGTLPFDTF